MRNHITVINSTIYGVILSFQWSQVEMFMLEKEPMTKDSYRIIIKNKTNKIRGN